MIKRWRVLLSDDTAATAVEYGLIVALIALAMMTGLGLVGGETTSLWQSVSGKASEAMGGSAP